MAGLEIRDGSPGIRAVVASPGQVISEAGERALNSLDVASPIAKTQDPIGDDCCDTLLGDVSLRGPGRHRDGLRYELTGHRGELDPIDPRMHPGVPGDTVLHAVGSARCVRVADIDGA